MDIPKKREAMAFETEDERKLLRNRLRVTLGVAISVALVSSWLFYDLYWKWRVELSGGEFTDPAGRLLYREFAIWGLMSVISFGLCLAAGLGLRRARQNPSPQGSPDPT